MALLPVPVLAGFLYFFETPDFCKGILAAPAPWSRAPFGQRLSVYRDAGQVFLSIVGPYALVVLLAWGVYGRWGGS